MKIFIFGAGASKGSQTENPSVEAPLVNDLFNDKYSTYANGVGLNPSQLLRCQKGVQKARSLETWLTQTWKDIKEKNSLASKQRDLNMFGKITLYIWWLMQNLSATYDAKNKYRVFMKRLADEDVPFGIINFNYDTLLDRAMVEELGYSLLGSLSDYTSVNYLKPHGSVNWFLLKRNGDPNVGRETSIDYRVRLDAISSNMYKTDPISSGSVVHPPTHLDLQSVNFLSGNVFSHQYGYPLILIPLTTKLYEYVAGFQEQVIQNAQSLVDEADEIYLIGYRAQDDVIKKIFKNIKSGAKLHIVSKGEAEEIFTQVCMWKPEFIKGKILDGGFAEFVNLY